MPNVDVPARSIGEHRPPTRGTLHGIHHEPDIVPRDQEIVGAQHRGMARVVDEEPGRFARTVTAQHGECRINRSIRVSAVVGDRAFVSLPDGQSDRRNVARRGDHGIGHPVSQNAEPLRVGRSAI